MTTETDHGGPTIPASRPLNVVYFGLSGAFSIPPLEALIEAGFTIRAVVLPALTVSVRDFAPTPPYTRFVQSPASSTMHRRSLPLLTITPARSIVQISANHRIPIVEVARLRDPATLAALASFEPDVFCIACFSQRIPKEVFDLPRLGCLNVHPSLLPDNRGPDPLFWTFQRGDDCTGVTIHQMDEGLDTGPVVIQECIEVPEGISEVALEQRCATVGGELLVRAIRGLNSAVIRPQRQNESLASVYPWPAADDYSITPNRPARWAYNFACGIANRGQLISITTPERVFLLRAALNYDANATLGVPFVLDGDILSLQCSPGIFRARVTAA